MQCEPDEASSFTNPNVGPGTYASLRLKLDAWSSAVYGWQRGQKCSSPTRRLPSRSWGPIWPRVCSWFRAPIRHECQTAQPKVNRLYLKIPENFGRLILQDGFCFVHITLVCMVTFQFLAQFLVDHLSHPVLSRLILFYIHNTTIGRDIIKHNIRTSMNKRIHFFIKIYLSHFILERVMFVVCERWIGTGDRLLYSPQVLLSTIAAPLFHLGWGCLTVGHWGPQALCLDWFSLWHLVSNCLEPSVHLVISLFNVILLPLFFRLFTLGHLLIDGSVEGQYITIFFCINCVHLLIIWFIISSVSPQNLSCYFVASYLILL